MRFLYGFTILALMGYFASGCNSEAPAACNPALDPNACVAVPQCSGSMRDCKNGGLDGCETDSSQDINNCGACGNKCPNVASGHAICESGVCGAAPCGTRYLDCNGDPSDGCETDSQRSVDNCGACGTHCSSGGTNAGATCSSGQCRLACQAGYLDCNNDPSDGCETNGSQDTNNCGTCGNKCMAIAPSNAVCASGSCSLSNCTSPYLTCKGGATTSCEVNSSNDLNNCGSCNHVCDVVSNGSPKCEASNCGIGSCDQDFSDCDHVISNGCEEYTVFNPLHCGSCSPCPGIGLTTSDVDCMNRTCLYTCRGERYDVNGDGADGCEVADSGSPGHLKRNASGNRGNKDCDDARSADAFSGVIASDARVHTNPMVSNFNASTGATPDWWWVTATGAFGCINDYAISVSTTGGGDTPCYNFIYSINGVVIDNAVLTGKDSRSFSGGLNSYSDGNIFDFFVEKTCSTAVKETVTYTIGYHL